MEIIHSQKLPIAVLKGFAKKLKKIRFAYTIFHLMKNILLLFIFLYSFSPMFAQVRHYPLDGNGIEIIGFNNGILAGGTAEPFSTSDRFGQPNSALSFDGDDYMTIPSNGITSNEFSISAWVTLYSAVNSGSFRTIFSIGGTQGDQMFGVEDNQFGSGFYFNGYRVNSDTFRLETNTNPNTNQWYHITIVYGLDYAKLYLDGNIIDSSASLGSAPLYGSGISAYVGSRSPGNNGWLGKIDELKFYNYALTEADINSLFLGTPIIGSNHALLFDNLSNGIISFSEQADFVNLMAISGQHLASYYYVTDIDISTFKKGIYILTLRNKGRIFKKKIGN